MKQVVTMGIINGENGYDKWMCERNEDGHA